VITNNYYQLYIASVTLLAKTIVIKSEYSADAMNQWVKDYHQIDQTYDDKSTWKYYMNISGQYHFTDEMMSVVSLDTLETINFTRDNLVLHKATAKAYRYGTRQYQALVKQYPNQEKLILGIIYPVDIGKAISSEDNQILGYPPGLVEENEYTFIEKLQTWINGFFARWDVKAYSVTDSYYAPTLLAVFYINLITAIINIRLEACKTNEAHSFHVKMYLASHNGLDRYIPFMTLKQTLFFYRNILYIEKNSGQYNIFDWLTHNTMTVRNFPLDEYTMRHDLTRVPAKILPEVFFKRKNINGVARYNAVSTATVEEMLMKQDKLARDNKINRPLVLDEITTQMENAPSSVLQTKMLESSVEDVRRINLTLGDVLVNHWASLSAKGVYKSINNVVNPRTGENVLLDAKDSYLFALYAFCKMNKIPLTTLPKFVGVRVQNVKTIGN